MIDPIDPIRVISLSMPKNIKIVNQNNIFWFYNSMFSEKLQKKYPFQKKWAFFKS
jgi:hypothetical protein